MASGATHRWVRSPDVLWREGAFGVVLLPARAEQIIALDGSGAALWHELTRPSTTPELTTRLAATFGADSSEVAADIAPILAELGAAGAVTEA